MHTPAGSSGILMGTTFKNEIWTNPSKIGHHSLALTPRRANDQLRSRLRSAPLPGVVCHVHTLIGHATFPHYLDRALGLCLRLERVSDRSVGRRLSIARLRLFFHY